MRKTLCAMLVLGILGMHLAAVAAPADAEKPMAQDDPMQAVHRQLSASCFNDCWTLIDKRDRNEEDTENMLLLAYTSLWHWKQRTDHTPANLSVGYWLLSRVHALAGQADMAMLFAGKCLTLSEQNALPPFYVGYGYEALARAAALKGDLDAVRGMLAAARAKHAEVTDPDEGKLLATDLREIEAAIEGK